VAGVVLAAGTSSRLGRNKLLVQLAGEALVRRAVRRAVEAGLEPVLVVVGHEAKRVAAEVSGLPCRQVENLVFASGQHTSVRAGIAAVPQAAAAAVVMLADMPLVTAEMLAALVERYREGASRGALSGPDSVAEPVAAELAVADVAPGSHAERGPATEHAASGAVGAPRSLAVVSSYGGVVAPPILYDRALFPELLAIEGPGCAKQVLARHREETATLHWPVEDLVDLDEEGDLAGLQARLERRAGAGGRGFERAGVRA
jgi:molybdenum cofactor cytidylyltransferase